MGGFLWGFGWDEPRQPKKIPGDVVVKLKEVRFLGIGVFSASRPMGLNYLLQSQKGTTMERMGRGLGFRV